MGFRSFSLLSGARRVSLSSWKARESTGGATGSTPSFIRSTMERWIHCKMISTLSLVLSKYLEERLAAVRQSTSQPRPRQQALEFDALGV